MAETKGHEDHHVMMNDVETAPKLNQNEKNDENDNPNSDSAYEDEDEENTTGDLLNSGNELDDDGDELAVLLDVIHLDHEEVELFEAVGSGDVNLVNDLLQKMGPDAVQKLSKKYNEERDTVFHVAVRRQDEAMLEFLFFHVPNVESILYDTLLLAISESNVNVVQIILHEIDSNVKLKAVRGRLSELPRWHNSQFQAHMTPMMLAGITGNYELITIFGTRGEQIEPLSRYQRRRAPEKQKKRRNCCEDCFCCCTTDPLDQTIFDHLAADYQRLHEYQAKTSPSMLCYQANNSRSFDPILKSLQYMNELEVIKMIEIEFRQEYDAIISKLKDFSVQLIAKCENPLELDLLLSRSEGYHGAHDKYPRVIMAIEMGFREFVAHPHTQGTLYMEWAGDDWFEWRFLTLPEKLRQFLYRILFLPLYLLFLCGEQGNNHGRLLASPLSRCIYSCISQIFFIGLSMAEQTLELRQPRFRHPPNKYLEFVLAIFVVGQIRVLAKQYFTAPKIFFRQAWNWYDSINYALYCCCFCCWGMLYFRNREDQEYFNRYQPAERLNWGYMDLFMVADCFLAIGTVMASGRLLRYVQLHSTIGPIQVALGKMIKNISLFIPMFAIVFSSFALAITAIYAPYVSVSEEGEDKHALSTHMNTLYQMYWGLYGMTDTSSADMGTWLVKNGTQVDPYHYITAELAGKLLFSVYTLLGATILFSSMLVAYMVNTFGAIIEENEINWKFSRAEATKFTEKEKQQQEELYQDFIKTLIRRYFRYLADMESRALASAEEAATLSEDLEELQSLISNVLSRFEKHDGDRNDGDGDGGMGTEPSKANNQSVHSENLLSLTTKSDSKTLSDPKTTESKTNSYRHSYDVSSSKTKSQEKNSKGSSTNVSTTNKDPQEKPSVVQSAILKYTQILSSEQSPTQGGILPKSGSSLGKIPNDKSKSLLSANFSDKERSSFPTLPPKAPSQRLSSENAMSTSSKGIAKRQQPIQIISSSNASKAAPLSQHSQNDPLISQQFKKYASATPNDNRSIEKTQQVKDKAVQSSHVFTARNQFETIQPLDFQSTIQSGANNSQFSNNRSNTQSMPPSNSKESRKPPLPPLPTSPSSSDPSMNQQLKKKFS